MGVCRCSCQYLLVVSDVKITFIPLDVVSVTDVYITVVMAFVVADFVPLW